MQYTPPYLIHMTKGLCFAFWLTNSALTMHCCAGYLFPSSQCTRQPGAECQCSSPAWWSEFPVSVFPPQLPAQHWLLQDSDCQLLSAVTTAATGRTLAPPAALSCQLQLLQPPADYIRKLQLCFKESISKIVFNGAGQAQNYRPTPSDAIFALQTMAKCPVQVHC